MQVGDPERSADGVVRAVAAFASARAQSVGVGGRASPAHAHATLLEHVTRGGYDRGAARTVETALGRVARSLGVECKRVASQWY